MKFAETKLKGMAHTLRFWPCCVLMTLGISGLVGAAWSEEAESVPQRVTLRVDGLTADGGLLTDPVAASLPAHIEQVELWGLQFRDISSAELLLVGRVLDCKILAVSHGIAFADCLAAPSREDRWLRLSDRKNCLDLHIWLPELQLADQICSVDTPTMLDLGNPIRLTAVRDYWGYVCRAEGQSSRSRLTIQRSSE